MLECFLWDMFFKKATGIRIHTVIEMRHEGWTEQWRVFVVQWGPSFRHGGERFHSLLICHLYTMITALCFCLSNQLLSKEMANDKTKTELWSLLQKPPPSLSRFSSLSSKLQQVLCSLTVFLQRAGLYVWATAEGSECVLKLTGYWFRTEQSPRQLFEGAAYRYSGSSEFRLVSD